MRKVYLTMLLSIIYLTSIGVQANKVSAKNSEGSIIESIEFSEMEDVVTCGSISAVRIYDQLTDQPVSGVDALYDGISIDASLLPSNYYIAVETYGTIESVKIWIDGNNIGTENTPPYTYPGGAESGNSWNGGAGSYDLDASAYLNDNADHQCSSVSLAFQIVGGVCDNVTDAGSIQGGFTACSGDDFTIVNTNLPSGGSSALEYVWLFNPNGPELGGHSAISNSNFSELTTSNTESGWYRRCSRRAGCNDYPGESNWVEVTITDCPCDNVTDAGSIQGGFTACSGDDFTIFNAGLPTGGSGALEFVWLFNPNGPNLDSYSAIANSNTAELTTNNTESGYYRRCARRAGCSDYIGESNWVEVTINNNCNNLTPPSTLDCAGGFLWENNIDITTLNGASGIPAADLRFVDYNVTSFTIPGPYPAEFDGTVNISSIEAISWDAYLNRPNTGDQPNEQWRIIFRNNGATVYTSDYTEDLVTGTLVAETTTNLGSNISLDGIDEIILAHYEDDTYGSGSSSSANSVVPVSICINYAPPCLIDLLTTATSLPNTLCGNECVEFCYESPTDPEVVNAQIATIDDDNQTVTIRTSFAKTFVDNTYGDNAIGWSGGHSFNSLVGSDHLILGLKDGNGVLQMEMKLDYISGDGAAPSGFSSSGVLSMMMGNVDDVLSATSSLDQNLNTFGYVLLDNSPTTDSDYSVNATYPNWIYEVWYEVTVDLAAFGAAGFGTPTIEGLHASPSKTGNNSEDVVFTGCCGYNCNGSIDLTPENGSAPYTFSWSNGATSEDVTGLCAGDYTVDVTDANGCVTTATYTVSDDIPGVTLAPVTTTANTLCGNECIEYCYESPTDPEVINAQIATIDDDNQTVTIRTSFAKTFVDNTYGDNTIGWSGGHSFNSLVGSDHLILGLKDGNGVLQMEMKLDYISGDGAAPSGFACAGVESMMMGDINDVISATSSLDENLNTFGYVLLDNSPTTDSDYSVNASYPNWIYEVWYEVTVDLSVFGAAGFGTPTIEGLHASPSKTGNNSEDVIFAGCCGYNCDGTIDLTVDQGVAPFSFLWSNGETTEDIAGLCAGDYTVDVTDANGCVTTATYTVSDDVQGVTADVEAQASINCGDEPYVPQEQCDCTCDGKMRSFTVTYLGADGVSISGYDDTNQSNLVQTFNNVQNGDILTFNAIGALANDEFKSKTYLYINGGSETEIHTSCSVDIAGLTIGQFLVISYIDGAYNECGAENCFPECACEGKMRNITFLYNGSAGAIVVALDDNASDATVLATFNNVQPGDILYVDAFGILPGDDFESKTYLTVNGGDYLEIHTSCSQDIGGGTFGDFTIVGYTDGDGNQCGDPVPTQDCNGFIDLTVTSGMAPFTYLWSNGCTTEDLTGVCPGEYSVTVTAANGCTTVVHAVVDEEEITPVIPVNLTDDLTIECGQDFPEVTFDNGTLISYNEYDANKICSIELSSHPDYNYRNFWFHSFPTAYNKNFVWNDGQVVILADGTAEIFGKVENVDLPGSGFSIHYYFEELVDYDTWIAGGGYQSMDADAPQRLYGEVDFSKPNSIIGFGDFANSDLTLVSTGDVSFMDFGPRNVYGGEGVGFWIDYTGTVNGMPAGAALNPSGSNHNDMYAAIGDCVNVPDDDCNKLVVREWTVADGCDVQCAYTQSVSIMDTQSPELISGFDNMDILCDETVPEAEEPVFEDACDIELVLSLEETSSINADGLTVITRTWTATDDCGNSESTSYTITILACTNVGDTVWYDNDRDGIQDADENGVEGVTVNLISPGPDGIFHTADDVVVNTQMTDANGNYLFEGVVPGEYCIEFVESTIPADYIFTASNEGGDDTVDSDVDENGKTESFTVTSGQNDDLTWDAGIITCTEITLLGDPLEDIIIECGEEIPTAVTPNFFDPVDDSLEIVFTETEDPSDCEFEISRTWTATNDCGNQLIVHYYVFIVDTTAPTLEGVPMNAEYECLSDVPVPADVLPNDNCDENPEVSFTEISNGQVCSEILTRVWTVMDDCNNVTSYTQMISISDETSPDVVSTPADVAIECGDELPMDEPIFSDNCDDNLDVIVLDVESGNECPMIVTRTWTATDNCGNEVSTSQTITINDTTLPTATNLPQNVTIECNEMLPTDEPIFSDNCDSDLTIVFAEDNNTLACQYELVRTWTATDDCGNTLSIGQTITVTDMTAPTLTGVPMNISVECASEVPAPVEPIPSDNCDPNPVVNFSETSTTNGCQETLTRTWTVTDNCDNVTSYMQMISIADETNPVATIVPTNTTVLCGDDMPNDEPLFTDNCDENITIDYLESSETNAVGIQEITRSWTATDDCGNEVTVSQLVSVLPCTNIGDTVWYDTNQDGIQDADEIGVEGVTVNLVSTGPDGVYHTDDDIIADTQVTDGNGNYLFQEVYPGEYCIEFVASTIPSDYIFTGTDEGADDAADSDSNEEGKTEPFTVEPGQVADLTFDAGIYNPINIGDTVFNDLDQDGIQDAGEPGVPGVTVNLIGPGPDGLFHTDDDEVVATEITDENGNYLFEEVIPGTFCIEFVSSTLPLGTQFTDANQGGDDATDSDADAEGKTQSFTLTIGQDDDLTFDAGIIDPINIGDLVFNDLDQDGIQDADELGVPGVTVNLIGPGPDGLFHTGDDEIVATEITDENGNYLFEEVAPGTYCIEFVNSTLPTGAQFTDANQGGDDAADSDADAEGKTQPFTLTAGQDDDLTFDAGILDPVNIGDTVFNDEDRDGIQDEGEAGVSGITVNLISAGPDGLFHTNDDVIVDTQVTDENGNYLFSEVAPGEYCIEFVASTIPADYQFTLTDQGGDDTADSDADLDGKTGSFTVNAGQDDDLTFDAGIYTCSEITVEEPLLENFSIECSQNIPLPGVPNFVDPIDTNLDVAFNETSEMIGCTEVITRTWIATNDCENTTTYIQIITVVDTTSPVASNEPTDVTIECSEAIPTGEPSFTDNCDENLTIDFGEVINTLDCQKEIVRTWTATDECGNVTTVSQTITITDTTAPTLEGVPSNEVIECAADVPAAAVPTANDNCDENAVIDFNESSETTGCVITITRTWAVTDDCDNTTSYTQMITVEDTTSPVASNEPADVTISCTDGLPTDEPSFTDNCDIDLTIVFNENNAGNSCENGITRTWTATDDCGNNTTVTQVIIVMDEVAPTLIVPADAEVDCSNANIDPSNTGNGTASDNCSGVSVTYTDSPVTGSCPVTIVRTWMATDGCGNVASGNQQITIIDETAPDLSIPSDITVECDESTEMSNTGFATAIDACDDDVMISIIDGAISGSCPSLFTRTFTATDFCGNVSTGEQVITINDTTAPVLSSGPADASYDCDETIPASNAIFTDSCDDQVNVVMTEVNVSQACGYQLIRLFTATDDCGNETEYTQTITVTDSSAPVLSGLPSDITIECGTEPADDIVTALDNCDPNVTVSMTEVENGQGCDVSIVRTWTAMDACGNTTSESQTITFEDTTGPVIICPADITVNCENSNSTPAVTGNATATDNCSGASVTYIDGPLSGNCPAAFIRTWSAVDGCGNTSSCDQSISIIDENGPTLVVPADISILCGESTDESNTGSASAFDACGGASVNYIDESIGDCPVILTRTYTATDACGNTSVASQVITIVDTIAPVVNNGPADITIQCDGGVPTADPITFTDNCDDNVLVEMVDVMTDLNCGFQVIRTWTATDACGNVGIYSQTISVTDNIAPLLNNVPADATIVCGGNPPAPAVVTATDNCDDDPIVTFIEETTGSGCSVLITRTWTATDECGNEDSATQEISITDDVPPVLVGIPNDTEADCDNIPEPTIVTATDNCDDNVIVTWYEDTDFSTCPYTITRHYTAIDACGNLAKDNQVITVVDNSAPTFGNYPTSITASCDVLESYVLLATDACDNNVEITYTDNNFSGGCLGVIERTWIATDNCNNIATAIQYITLYDDQAPVILDAPENVTIDCGGVIPVAPELTVMDNCDSELEIAFSEVQNGNDCPYTITRTWTVVDDCDNETIASQIISVVTGGIVPNAEILTAPNPFNESTRISFILPEDGFVLLEVYSSIGDLVDVIFKGYALGGMYYEFNIDTDNWNSGMYHTKLIFEGEISSNKMIKSN